MIQPLALVAHIELIQAFLTPVDLCLVMRVCEEALQQVLLLVFNLQWLHRLAALRGLVVGPRSIEGQLLVPNFWELCMLGTLGELQGSFDR